MSQMRVLIPQDKIMEFCRRNQVKSLALFGSVLRADFGTDSDIDVLVEFQPEARVGFLAMGRMQRELTGLFHRQVDLVPKDGLKPLIRDTILSNTEVVYAG
jgi:predicted nucleotidyltransferase